MVLVIDLTWKMFSETGNIGAYLLLKELELDEINSEEDNYNEQPSKTSADVPMY